MRGARRAHARERGGGEAGGPRLGLQRDQPLAAEDGGQRTRPVPADAGRGAMGSRDRGPVGHPVAARPSPSPLGTAEQKERFLRPALPRRAAGRVRDHGGGRRLGPDDGDGRRRPRDGDGWTHRTARSGTSPPATSPTSSSSTPTSTATRRRRRCSSSTRTHPASSWCGRRSTCTRSSSSTRSSRSSDVRGRRRPRPRRGRAGASSSRRTGSSRNG